MLFVQFKALQLFGKLGKRTSKKQQIKFLCVQSGQKIVILKYSNHCF